MAFYGKARVSSAKPTSRTQSRTTSGSSRSGSGGSSSGSSQYKNNRGEPIPLNRSGKPVFTPDPIQSPDYYKAPEDPFKEVNPEGYGADRFGVEPAQLHMPTRQLTPEEQFAYKRGQDRVVSRTQQLQNDPRWIAAQEAAAAARASGDKAAWMAANGGIMRALDQIKRDNQWGISHGDPDANYPKPRSVSGNYQYGEGRPGPTPPNVAKGGGGGNAVTQGPAGLPATAPSKPSMIEGYQGEGGGPGGGVPQQMQGMLAALSQMQPAQSRDTARKAAMGMPAHLLDPSYKPGSNKR